MADGRFKRSLHARQWVGIVPCSPVLPAVPGWMCVQRVLGARRANTYSSWASRNTRDGPFSPSATTNPRPSTPVGGCGLSLPGPCSILA